MAVHTFEVIIGGENQGLNSPQYAGSTTHITPHNASTGVHIDPAKIDAIWYQPVDNIMEFTRFSHIDVKPQDHQNVKLEIMVVGSCLLRLRIFILYH